VFYLLRSPDGTFLNAEQRAPLNGFAEDVAKVKEAGDTGPVVKAGGWLCGLRRKLPERAPWYKPAESKWP